MPCLYKSKCVCPGVKLGDPARVTLTPWWGWVRSFLADNRHQLGRLLDLYLGADFSREMLTDRKTRLEETITALEHERADLVTKIEAATLTDDQIASVLDFAAALAPGLDEAEEDFTARRMLVGKLRVQAVLTREADGHKIANVSCVLGKEILDLRKSAPVL